MWHECVGWAIVTFPFWAGVVAPFVCVFVWFLISQLVKLGRNKG